jgi:hypothetical protein
MSLDELEGWEVSLLFCSICGWSLSLSYWGFCSFCGGWSRPVFEHVQIDL